MANSLKLLLLGGSQYLVPSIQVARDAGFFTLVADRNPEAAGLKTADVGLNIDIFDYEGLYEAVAHYGGIDGVVALSEAGVRPAAQISHDLGLPSISISAAENATSKARMRELWSQSGYSVQYHLVHTEAEAYRAAEAIAALPLIVKPDRSFGGSRGVSILESLDELPGAIDFARAGGLPESGIIIEEFVPAITEHSAEVLIWDGKISVLCIGQKTKTPLPYRVDWSVAYPSDLTPEQEASVSKMCEVAVMALGLTQGVAHIEFAFSAGRGPLLFEVGARCGGGHTPQIALHASGVNEFVEACRIACGLPPEVFLPTRKMGADYRFLLFPEGTIAETNVPAHIQSHPQVYDAAITFEPGHEIKRASSAGLRAGYAVIFTETREEALSLGNEICQQVTIRYDDGQIHSANILPGITPRHESAFEH